MSAQSSSMLKTSKKRKNEILKPSEDSNSSEDSKSPQELKSPSEAKSLDEYWILHRDSASKTKEFLCPHRLCGHPCKNSCQTLQKAKIHSTSKGIHHECYSSLTCVWYSQIVWRTYLTETRSKKEEIESNLKPELISESDKISNHAPAATSTTITLPSTTFLPRFDQIESLDAIFSMAQSYFNSPSQVASVISEYKDFPIFNKNLSPKQFISTDDVKNLLSSDRYLPTDGMMNCKRLTKIIYERNYDPIAQNIDTLRRPEFQFPFKWENAWPSSISDKNTVEKFIITKLTAAQPQYTLPSEIKIDNRVHQMETIMETLNVGLASNDHTDNYLGLLNSRVWGVFVGTPGTQINFHIDPLPGIAQPLRDHSFKLWLFIDAQEAWNHSIFSAFGTPKEFENNPNFFDMQTSPQRLTTMKSFRWTIQSGTQTIFIPSSVYHAVLNLSNNALISPPFLHPFDVEHWIDLTMNSPYGKFSFLQHKGWKKENVKRFCEIVNHKTKTAIITACELINLNSRESNLKQIIPKWSKKLNSKVESLKKMTQDAQKELKEEKEKEKKENEQSSEEK